MAQLRMAATSGSSVVASKTGAGVRTASGAVSGTATLRMAAATGSSVVASRVGTGVRTASGTIPTSARLRMASASGSSVVVSKVGTGVRVTGGSSLAQLRMAATFGGSVVVNKVGTGVHGTSSASTSAQLRMANTYGNNQPATSSAQLRMGWTGGYSPQVVFTWDATNQKWVQVSGGTASRIGTGVRTASGTTSYPITNPLAIVTTTAGADYTSASSAGAVSSVTVAKPTNTRNGDLLLVVVFAQVAFGSGQDFGLPPGAWQVMSPAAVTTDRPTAVYALPVPSAAALTATSFTFTSPTSGRMGAVLYRVVGANLSAPLDAAGARIASGQTTIAAMPGVVTNYNGSLVLAVGHATGTAAQSWPTWNTPPAGFTQVGAVLNTTSPSGSASNDSLWLASMTQTGSGGSGTGTVTETVSPPQTALTGFLVALRSAPLPQNTIAAQGIPSAGAMGVPTIRFGAASAQTIAPSGIPTAEGVGAPRLWGPGETPAQAWIRVRAGGAQYAAHRDGSYSTYGEETLEGYRATAAYTNAVALEISLWRTSDGVWVCSHDQTTARVFNGTNYTITSTAWTTLSPSGSSTTGRPTTIIGNNPMRRLEEIIGDTQLTNRIFVIDNKQSANNPALITLLNSTIPGRWIAKSSNASSWQVAAAQASQVPIWSYMYPADLPNLDTNYTYLLPARQAGSQIIFGFGDYSSGASAPTQAQTQTFLSYTQSKGIMAWAHILATSAQKATADSMAATASAYWDGYMISAVASVLPSSPTTISGVGHIPSAERFGVAHLTIPAPILRRDTLTYDGTGAANTVITAPYPSTLLNNDYGIVQLAWVHPTGDNPFTNVNAPGWNQIVPPTVANQICFSVFTRAYQAVGGTGETGGNNTGGSTGNNYNATFHPVGGTPAPSVQSVAWGTPVTQPPDPALGSLVFTGWYLPGATTPFDFTVSVGGTLDLWARYADPPFTATFDDARLTVLTGVWYADIGRVDAIGPVGINDFSVNTQTTAPPTLLSMLADEVVVTAFATGIRAVQPVPALSGPSVVRAQQSGAPNTVTAYLADQIIRQWVQYPGNTDPVVSTYSPGSASGEGVQLALVPPDAPIGTAALFTPTVTLSAVGTVMDNVAFDGWWIDLTAQGVVMMPGTFAAGVTLAAVGTPIMPANFSPIVTLTTRGARLGVVKFTPTVSLSVIGTPKVTGSPLFAARVNLAALGKLMARSAATLGPSVTISTAGRAKPIIAALFGPTVTLTAVGKVRVTGTALFSANVAFRIPSTKVTQRANAGFSLTAKMTPWSPMMAVKSNAALTPTVTLTAVGTPDFTPIARAMFGPIHVTFTADGFRRQQGPVGTTIKPVIGDGGVVWSGQSPKQVWTDEETP